VDRGRADVQDYYPGYWADPYPFVTASHPYDIEEAFQSAAARRYFAGTAAGNPVSKIFRRWPVEELHAEGFGSLADHSMQDARGKGVWQHKKWTVVLALPRRAPDPANPRLRHGTTTHLAFAVWNGRTEDVGGRKQWAPFLKLHLP
jgi:DMSO reductase family type II enzyme heme b subunit